MGFLPVSQPVPLAYQLPVDDASLFVVATILDSAGDEVSGSPVELAYIEKGNYGSSAFLMPNTPWIKVIYEVFNDEDFEDPSLIYGNTEDIIYLEASSGSGGPTQSPRLIGVIGQADDDLAQCSTPCSNPLDIVQGADIDFNVLFMNNDTKLPFDLTSATAISAKFLNTDGTFLTRTLSGGLTIVSPAVLGQIQISLTAAQTAALQYGRVSMEITLSVGGATFVVQFPYLLNVLQSVFV